ncbi:hypothetical protein GCM10027443_33710 [Pontibacter brevis]
MAPYDRAWVLLHKEMGANIGEEETAKDVFGAKLKDGKRFVKFFLL